MNAKTEPARLTITELKALAYDRIAAIERLRNDLSTINAEIERRYAEEAKKLKVSPPSEKGETTESEDAQ
jgi:tRNA A37 threonylcarbamoyladenosine dehydratase